MNVEFTELIQVYSGKSSPHPQTLLLLQEPVGLRKSSKYSFHRLTIFSVDVSSAPPALYIHYAQKSKNKTTRIQIQDTIPPNHAPPGLTVIGHMSVEVSR